MDDQKMFGLLERLASDVLSRGLLTLADELVTPDIELESPLVSLRGLADFKNFIIDLRARKPDFTVKVTSPEVIGRDLIATMSFADKVAVDAAPAPAPGTGKFFSVSGRVAATIRDHRICRLNVGYLVDEWLRQIQSIAADDADVTRSITLPPATGATASDELSDDEKIERFRTMTDLIFVRGLHGAAADLLTEDFVYESPLTHLVGVDVCNRYIRDVREAWQDLKLDLFDIVVNGRDVAASFNLDALHARTFYGVDATFKRFTLRGTVKVRLRGDRISRVRVIYFLNEWLRQVGAEQNL